MLRHIAMWKLRDENMAANLAGAKRLLRSCAAWTPGLLRFEEGTARPGYGATYDLIVNSNFTDDAVLAAYQNHPGHVAIRPFGKRWCSSARAWTTKPDTTR